MSFGTDNQRVEKAEQKAKKALAEGVQTEDTERVQCPKCHHQTLVTKTEAGDYCFYCMKEYPMVRCTSCHNFVTEEETDEYGMCPECCLHESMIVP